VQLAVDADIAMGPALRLDEVVEDPHLRARGQLVAEHHPELGDLVTFGNPVVVPGEDFTVRSAPTLGQHTDEVLAELGYDAETRERLHATKVV